MIAATPIPTPNAHMTTQAQQVLIVGPSWVGDTVMAQSLFRLLLKQHSDLAIDVLAPAWSLPLLARMPEVRSARESPWGPGALKLAGRYRFGQDLRAWGYTWSIVLPNSFKSALVPFWARIPRRTGYLGEGRWGVLNDVRRLDKTRLKMAVQRFVALGLPSGAPFPEIFPLPDLKVDTRSVACSLEALGLKQPERLLALCPGAEFGPAKRWPPEYFAEIARRMRAQGWAVWVFGSARDAEPARRVCERAGGGFVNLAGRTTLGEAIDLLSLASAVVTNDSGLMHVACALNRPLVAVYGSSDPGFTPPLNRAARIEYLGLPCSPCFKPTCPLGHLDCLRTLEPERVMAALEGLR
ncbi:MAG: lipopolysaccharide heptosyltransferase II [Gammaproteobacteria bacterium]